MTKSFAPQRARVRSARAYITDLWDRREFAWFLALGNLKARNASTALGLAWWVLNPMLLGAVYFFVFGLVFSDSRPASYIGYLLTGMFAFHFTAQSMSGGANSILQNSKLLANLKFPRLILPIANLIEGSFGFLGALGVLFVIVSPIAGITPGLHIFWLFLALPVHLLFNLGLATMAARLAVPFRDINNIIPYVSRLWLYLSPVIWPLDLLDDIDDYVVVIAQTNPLFDIIALYRGAVLGSPVTAANVYRSVTFAVVFALIGVFIFVRNENKMVRYL